MIKRAGRCLWLFVSLVGMIFLYPLFQDFPVIGIAITSVTLVSSVWAFADDPRHLRLLGGLALIGVLLAIPALELRSKWFGIAASISLAAFYGRLLAIVLRFAVTGAVTTEKLVAVASGYIIAGIFWATLYRMVALFLPSAFHSISGLEPDVMYFSFITLSTIGYGDVTALEGPARSLAITEGIFGVFYVAVLVSRMVNLATTMDDEDQD